jgi:methylmalonyl-CoA mutase, N-terminal domain
MQETEDKRGKFTTWSGIPIKELYTPEDVQGLDYKRDIGYPGQPPFTRGVYRDMYRGRQFTIRRFAGVETPEDTNRLYRHELELGQTGLAIAPDVPTSTGLDSDNPRCQGDVGFCGVPIDSIQDMQTIFDNIPLNEVTTWTYTIPITAMYFVNAQDRGYDLKVLGGSTPTVTWPTPSALDQPWQVSIEGREREAMDFAEWTASNVPKWHGTSISVYAAKDNGLSCIQELGVLIGIATSAADTWKKRGKVPLEVFFRRISFEMATASDFFEEVCKLRAGRRMWAKVCRERYGITDPKLMQFRVRCQTQGSTNVIEEPLNNIVRIGFGMLASTLGGAQSLHANGYDEALCIPTDQSMLLSIRTLQIIQEEINVTSTVDPLAGSYYVEWLTNELEKRTWDYLRKIDGMGGMIAAIKSGFFAGEYKQANLDWVRKIETGERVVVGTNKYRLKPEEVPYQVPVYRFEPTCRDRQIERVKKLRRERDKAKVATALADLDRACRGDENTFPLVMEAFRSYATLQEVYDVWREVYGINSYSRMQL